MMKLPGYGEGAWQLLASMTVKMYGWPPCRPNTVRVPPLDRIVAGCAGVPCAGDQVTLYGGRPPLACTSSWPELVWQGSFMTLQVPAVGRALTVQDTWLTFELQPEPSQLRRLSTRFVPVTAAKLGKPGPQELQLLPLSVECLYSSVHEPVPPLPAVVTVIVRVVPSHTAAVFGLLAMTGAMGSATTVQDTWFTFEAQPEPSQLRRLSTRFVPVTAAKLGKLGPQELQLLPLSVECRYSSVQEPVPPLPGVVIVIVRVAPAQTVASAGLLAITGATGSATITKSVAARQPGSVEHSA